MAVTKVLARDWTVEVDDGTGTYLTVNSLDQITFAGNKNDTDVTDFDSAGWEEHLVSQRGRTLTLQGNWLEDPSTGTLDAGLQRLLDLNDLVGAAAASSFRMTSPGGNVKTFSATVNFGQGPDGATNDQGKWQAEVKVSGQVA